jgi:hypothetical protein
MHFTFYHRNTDSEEVKKIMIISLNVADLVIDPNLILSDYKHEF